MNLKVTISIDDVHPEKGWRILGDKTEKWLRSLNEEFGAKFTLFIPSNYHNQYPLSKYKEWVTELSGIDWLELAAHGHYHQTSDPKRFGECEFAELDRLVKCENRLVEILGEWWFSGITPVGWKNPGWLCSSEWNEYCNYLGTERIEEIPAFEYIALHYEHNHGMKWNCKEFFGHDGIQQENISIHNGDMIMFTSHIAGNWNHNVWNEQNYEQLKLSLSHLIENYECEFKTLNQCL